MCSSDLSQGPPPEAVDAGTLVFNELIPGNAATFEVELFNYGEEAVSMGGCLIRRTGSSPDADFALPVQSVPAGGFLVLSQAAPGFSAVSTSRNTRSAMPSAISVCTLFERIARSIEFGAASAPPAGFTTERVMSP